MKKVQISENLFVMLLKYFLLNETDDYYKIQFELNQKLDAMVMHDSYSRYKTAPTKQQREKARQKYLDLRGIKESFRW